MKKAPPMNFGLVARITPQRESASAVTVQPATRQQSSTSVPTRAATIIPAVVAPITPTATAGFVRTQATTINARTEIKGGIRLAPATVCGTPEDFPPLIVQADTTSEAMESVYNDNTHYSGDADMDEHEEREEDSGNGLTTSYGAKSNISVSTAGQSIVTFAQMAMR
jgi:hypothetical protein